MRLNKTNFPPIFFPRNGFQKNSQLRTGVSLLEVLVATIILVISFFPIMAVFSTTTQGTLKDFNQINAMHLAESKLNQILQVDFASATVGVYPVGGARNALINWPPPPFNAIAALGTEANLINNTQFFSQLQVEMIPVVNFTYRQMANNINTDYSNSNSWTQASWDGAPGDPGSLKNMVVRDRLKKYSLRVEWTERRGQGAATIDKVYLLHTLKAQFYD